MPNAIRLIPAYIITAFKLFLLQFILLSCFRIIFYFSCKTPDVSNVPASTLFMAFRMGFEFDMVVTTYSLLLPVFLLLLNEIFFSKTALLNRLSFLFTFIFFSLYALVSCADFPYFKQFSSHINKQAFMWTASPDFVFRMIFGNISYYGYLFVFVLLVIFHFIALRRIFATNLKLVEQKQSSRKNLLISFVLFVPLIIGGGRGRLSSKATTHEGLAIVSDNLFVNQLALNPNFTLFRSLFFQKVKNYHVPADIKDAIQFAKKYLGSDDTAAYSVSRLQRADSAFRNWNVVIVCMESMSSYKMGIQGRPVLTPNFNSIVKESLYFDRFFSSGIHTFNGLFSTASGFPSMLTEHALRRYTKHAFTTLANLLEKKNYSSYFFSTHDPHFDNMHGFFTLNGFQKTLSAFDLPKEKTISATGVGDHEIFKLFFNTIGKSNPSKPFISFMMTGSDHGPWAIPADIPFKPDAETEEKRATQYADWSLGEFIKEAKQQDWYRNTLFVFVADHGYYTDGAYEMPISYHHIPFVLHKPDALQPDTNHNLGYQPDILSTVAGLMNIEFKNNSFGINIIRQKHPFVFFTADDKIGCVSDDGYYFYDLLSQNTKRLRRYPQYEEKDYYSEKKTKADSLEKSAKTMLKAAEFFIRRDYFSY